MKVTNNWERTLVSIVISSSKIWAMILKCIKKNLKKRKESTWIMMPKSSKKIFKKFMRPEGPLSNKSRL